MKKFFGAETEISSAEALDRVGDVLEFLAESVGATPSEGNYELSRNAAAGLVWILDSAVSQIRESNERRVLKEEERNGGRKKEGAMSHRRTGISTQRVRAPEQV